MASPDAEEDDQVSGNGASELEPLSESEPQSSHPKMLVPLFLVPMLIVAVIVGVFFGFGALVGEPDSSEELLHRIETGGLNERWQAAAALVHLVDQQENVDLLRADSRFQERLLGVLENDVESMNVRAYLALLAARLKDGEAVPHVIAAIETGLEQIPEAPSRAREDLETALFTLIRAVGAFGDEAASDVLLRLTRESDQSYRMVATFALGDLYFLRLSSGDKVPESMHQRLVELHDDEDLWVRINSAFALAKLGFPEGLPTLELILDRHRLKELGQHYPDSGLMSVQSADPSGTTLRYALISVENLATCKKLPKDGATERIRELVRDLAGSDPNRDVQDDARRLLRTLEGEGSESR